MRRLKEWPNVREGAGDEVEDEETRSVDSEVHGVTIVLEILTVSRASDGGFGSAHRLERGMLASKENPMEAPERWETSTSDGVEPRISLCCAGVTTGTS